MRADKTFRGGWGTVGDVERRNGWRSGWRRWFRAVAAVLLVGFLAACGGDDSTGPGSDGDPNDPGDGPFNATVDGESFSTMESTQTPATYIAPGVYTMTGSFFSGSTFHSIALSLSSIAEPGTYPLGTGANVSGGTAIYANSAGGWGTPLSGAAGVITITELTNDRIRATFSFRAEATSGGATGTKSITNGSLDLPINRQVPAGEVPDQARNVIQAMIGGQFWNAATVATTGSPSTALIWAASNTHHSATMTLRNLTGPGTFDIASAGLEATIGVGSVSGDVPCCWNSTQAGATGTITVTSLTSSRCVGTFEVTLPAVPETDATEAIVVTSGEFDIGF